MEARVSDDRSSRFEKLTAGTPLYHSLSVSGSPDGVRQFSGRDANCEKREGSSEMIVNRGNQTYSTTPFLVPTSFNTTNNQIVCQVPV